MDKKRIRTQALERMSFGLDRQHVFDELMVEHPDAKPKKVAEIIRYIPTLHGREYYRSYHQLLLLVIGVYGLLRLLQPLLEEDFAWTNTFRLVTLAPIATLLLAYNVYRWEGQVFEWMAWVNLWGGISLLNGLLGQGRENGDLWSMGSGILSVLIGALALYLSKHVFPKYTVEKDPLGQRPPRIVFPPESGMMV
jgi:hypothetical protein